MRNAAEKLGAFWVSRVKETTQGTWYTTSLNLMRLPFEPSSRMKLDRSRKDDRDLLTGVEGPTTIYEEARKASGKVSMNTGFPEFLCWLLAYWFGTCSSSQTGTYAYEHTITPRSDPEVRTFSAYQKAGDGVFAQGFAGCAVDGFEINISDGWVKASGDLVGMGKARSDYIKQTGQLATSTTLILAAYTPSGGASADGTILADGGPLTDLVSGSTETERLANIHLLLVKKDGDWQQATPTACTAPEGGPSQITFSGVTGLDGDEDYEIVYKSSQGDSWSSPPTLYQSSPMRLADASLLLKATFDGSEFTGGYTIDTEWSELVIKGANGLIVENLPGTSKIYGGRVMRGQRILTISLTETARQAVMVQRIDADETFSMQLTLTGAVIETGLTYSVIIQLPKVGILGHDLMVKDKVLAHKGDLIALEDSTYGIGQAICQNKMATFV